MIEKNDNLCGTVEGIGSNGEGIIRHEGITFFVPYSLPLERVRFKVLKVKGNIGYGKVEEVISPAPCRVKPVCEVFEKCGGCCLQHLAYEEQLVHKGNVVKDALRKIGGLNVDVPSAIKSDLPYAYRNKLQLPIGVDKEGNSVIGFYAERSHRIIPLEKCAIHPDWAETLILALKRFIKETGAVGYDEEKKTGVLRHIVAREIGGKYIFTLVCAKRKLARVERLIAILQETFAHFTLYLNFNDKDTNVIFGEEFSLVYGEGFFDAEEQGIRYEAGPVTFLQVNENVRTKLYKKALETVVKTGEEVVVDAYSGGGLLTAMIDKRAKRVYGIELEKEASACADKLKEKNGLKNMTNICGYVEEKLPFVLEKEKKEKLRLILDPPRAGIARSVLKALLESGIPALTIISCNPATLARDLGVLTGSLIENEKGELVKNVDYTETGLDGYYQISSIQPYDMFPQTKHVETLVCLSHKKPDGHISVNVEFGEEEGQVSLKDIEKRALERAPKKKRLIKIYKRISKKSTDSKCIRLTLPK